jgi:GMP synthase (glutamine-hydrolysing)
MGTLGGHQRAVVDRRYGEPIGAVTVSLTPEGREDPLTGGLPGSFDAFVGHKEAISVLPAHAVLLATSPACPVQAFRVGRHVYATQFHPELDLPGLRTRILVYRDAGYFPPAEVDELLAEVARSAVVHPPQLLRRFVELYG